MASTNWFVPDWPAPASVRSCITQCGAGSPQTLYGNFNLAQHVGDDAARVEQNRAFLAKELALTHPIQWLEQVHGVKVVEAQADGMVRTADGAITQQRGLACAVLTADCLPLLFCDQAGTQVAAIHAGWRGLAGGIIARTLEQFSTPASGLMVYLGPAISQPFFEVGIEVLEAFFERARDDNHSEAIFQAFIPGVRPLHFHADLYALAKAELTSLGVEQVFGGNACTYRDAATYYSYRRQNITGRFASLIWLEE